MDLIETSLKQTLQDLGREPSPLSQIYEWIEGALHGGLGRLVVAAGGGSAHVDAQLQNPGQRPLRVRCGNHSFVAQL